MKRAGKRVVAVLLFACALGVANVRADVPLPPPWVDAKEPPLAAWARSVSPKPDDRRRPGDMVLFTGPSRGSERRGVTAPGAALPIFGARRGSGCTGAWWLVGPVAWTCSDDGILAPEEPSAPEVAIGSDGLAREYFFVGRKGASAYADITSADEGTADRELEGGWGVAIVEQRSAAGASWARTSKGLWVATSDLVAARPSGFHGEHLEAEPEGPLAIAWVLAEHANVWAELPRASAHPTKPKSTRARFDLVHVAAESGAYVSVGEGEWMLARDLARPHSAPPPAEAARPGERWIDVELASQTLVAYEGAKPVYATLVSTGRGEPGSDAATPPGVHRIWVKIFASDMANVERDDLDAHYSLEDVPYVQFFDRAVALHGTYWHRDFGHRRSHGCVNLAPLDARWTFEFTGPRLPAGWTAAYPAPRGIDPGTVIRVH